MLPKEYIAQAVQRELDRIIREQRRANEFLTLTPQASAPLSPLEGWVAISDGTGSGFDGSSGAGLYRYSGSAWVYIG